MARKRGRSTGARRTAAPREVTNVSAELSGLAEEIGSHHETGPGLTGGDVDADWQRAHMSGEEAVGGSVQTPDQDTVDDLTHALGVEEDLRSPIHGVEEILAERDRLRWDLEEAAAAEEGEKEEEREGRR